MPTSEKPAGKGLIVLDANELEFRERYTYTDAFIRARSAHTFDSWLNLNLPWLGDALAGYWHYFFLLAVRAILIVMAVAAFRGAFLEFMFDDPTATALLEAFFRGAIEGLIWSLILLPGASMVLTIAHNGRIAKHPLWVAAVLGYLCGSPSLAPIMYQLVGNTEKLSFWAAFGSVSGAAIGAISAVAARVTDPKFALDLASAAEKKDWSERVQSLLRTGELTKCLWMFAGLPIGGLTGSLWGSIVFGLRTKYFRENALPPTAVFVFLGLAIGFGSAAVLTPKEWFFGRWHVKRLAAEGSFMDADHKRWNGICAKDVVSIDLSGTNVRARDLKGWWWNSFPNLRSLSVARCNVGDWWMLSLSRPDGTSQLESVDISFTGGRGLWIGAWLPKLKTLKLVGCNLGANIEWIGVHPSIDYADIDLVKAPIESFESLRKQRPDIKFSFYTTTRQYFLRDQFGQ
jgi:hypothetical protein